MVSTEARMGYTLEPPFRLGVAIQPHKGLFVAMAIVKHAENNDSFLEGGIAGSTYTLDDTGYFRPTTTALLNIEVVGDPSNGDTNIDKEICRELVDQRGEEDRKFVIEALGAQINSIGPVNIADQYFCNSPDYYFEVNAIHRTIVM